MPEPEEVLDPAKLPPFPQIPPLIAVLPLLDLNLQSSLVTMLFLWIVSGIGRIVAKRFDAAGRDPWSRNITRVYLIVVGPRYCRVSIRASGSIAARHHPCGSFSVSVGTDAANGMRAFKPQFWQRRMPEMSAKDCLVAPYHSLWRLSYAGGLLAMIGLSLSFKNWASLLIMCGPACALVLGRIRTIPAGALTEKDRFAVNRGSF